MVQLSGPEVDQDQKTTHCKPLRRRPKRTSTCLIHAAPALGLPAILQVKGGNIITHYPIGVGFSVDFK